MRGGVSLRDEVENPVFQFLDVREVRSGEPFSLKNGEPLLD